MYEATHYCFPCKGYCWPSLLLLQHVTFFFFFNILFPTPPLSSWSQRLWMKLLDNRITSLQSLCFGRQQVYGLPVTCLLFPSRSERFCNFLSNINLWIFLKVLLFESPSFHPWKCWGTDVKCKEMSRCPSDVLQSSTSVACLILEICIPEGWSTEM